MYTRKSTQNLFSKIMINTSYYTVSKRRLLSTQIFIIQIDFHTKNIV